METLTPPEMINAQDMTVALSVQRCIPSIAALVDAVHPRVARGGRVIYVGAGTSGRLGILDSSEMYVCERSELLRLAVARTRQAAR